jgi:hypothetical protein
LRGRMWWGFKLHVKSHWNFAALASVREDFYRALVIVNTTPTD